MAKDSNKKAAIAAYNKLLDVIAAKYPDLSREKLKFKVKDQVESKTGISISVNKNANFKIIAEAVEAITKTYDIPNPLSPELQALAKFGSQAGPGESALSQPEPSEGGDLETTENAAGKEAFNNVPTEGPPFQPPNPTTFSVNTNGQFIKNEPIENKIAETLNDIDNIQKQTKAGQKVVKAETAQEVSNLKAVAATIPITELPSATKANEKDYKESLIFRDPIQEAQERYNDYIRQIKKTSMYY